MSRYLMLSQCQTSSLTCWYYYLLSNAEAYDQQMYIDTDIPYIDKNHRLMVSLLLKDELMRSWLRILQTSSYVASKLEHNKLKRPSHTTPKTVFNSPRSNSNTCNLFISTAIIFQQFYIRATIFTTISVVEYKALRQQQ